MNIYALSEYQLFLHLLAKLTVPPPLGFLEVHRAMSVVIVR